MVRVCVGAYTCNLIDIAYLIWIRVVAKCYVINSLENACRTVSWGGCGGAPSLRHCLPLFSHLIGRNVSPAHSPTLPPIYTSVNMPCVVHVSTDWRVRNICQILSTTSRVHREEDRLPPTNLTRHQSKTLPLVGVLVSTSLLSLSLSLSLSHRLTPPLSLCRER